MKWSILIPSVVTRKPKLQKLINMLEPQIERYDGDIQVLIYWNNFETPLSKIRQALLEYAKGDYISFIDDDDEIPPYYCQEIYKRLDGVDYIGFKMDFYQNGVLQKPVIHSLANEGWFDDDKGFYRRATFLNPVRRDLANQCTFDVGTYAEGIAEDTAWAQQLSEILRTEHFIDRSMYYYHNWPNESVFRRTLKEEGSFMRPILPKYFSYHPMSTENSE